MLILRNGKLIAYTSIRQRTPIRNILTLRHSIYHENFGSYFATSGLLASCLVEFYSQLPSLSVPSPLPLSRYRALLLPSPSLVVQCRRHLRRFQRPASRAPPVPNHLQPVPRISSPLLSSFFSLIASRNLLAPTPRRITCTCVCVCVCVCVCIYVCVYIKYVSLGIERRRGGLGLRS